MKIHLYFHFFEYGILKDEWYKDCQDVVNKFNDSWDTIDEVLWNNRNKIFDRFFKCGEKKLTIFEKLLEKFGKDDIKEDDIAYLNYLEYKEHSVISDIDSSKFSPSEKEVLDIFQSTKNFEQRIKAACNLYLSDKSAYENCCSFIPLNYQNYISLLGPKKIKALRCNEKAILEEIETINKTSSVEDLIYKEIEVGKTYSLKDLKSIISNIFNTLGITNRSSKASDLSEYFELKPRQITNKETGKRDKAFEIVRRRS